MPTLRVRTRRSFNVCQTTPRPNTTPRLGCSLRLPGRTTPSPPSVTPTTSGRERQGTHSFQDTCLTRPAPPPGAWVPTPVSQVVGVPEVPASPARDHIIPLCSRFMCRNVPFVQYCSTCRLGDCDTHFNIPGCIHRNQTGFESILRSPEWDNISVIFVIIPVHTGIYIYLCVRAIL